MSDEPPQSRSLMGNPTYLRGGSAPVFAVHHPPAARASGLGVLICPPFGNAELCCHRSLREWAIELSLAGHAAMRIDLPGAGDSAGGPYDGALVQRSIAAVTEAAAWLRAQAGVEGIAAIGIGLGGMLACASAATDAEIEHLVLWSVPARGATHVRELRAFGRMQASSEISFDDQKSSTEHPQPALVSGGFSMSEETVRELRALDLASLEYPRAPDGRVLMLQRERIEVDEVLRERLHSAGYSVTVAPGEGYTEMMLEPYDSRPPRGVFSLVGDWLAELSATTHSECPSDSDRSPTSDRASHSDRTSHSERTSSSERVGMDGEEFETVELTVAGSRIRETPFTVAHPEGRLVGVLARPAQGTPEACVVFLNAGALRRVGPNRLWVEASRRFAARGVAAVRIDLSGIGDADGDDTGWSLPENFYILRFVGQARVLLDFLADRGVAQRFVLAGMCSGAFWSFHGTRLDERVLGAMMVNTRVLFWDGQRGLVREADNARKLIEPRLWLKTARGGIPMQRVVVFARAVLRLAARLPSRLIARARERAGVGDRVDLALDTIQAAGKQLTMIWGPREFLRLELESSGRMEKLMRRQDVTVELLDGDTEVHTLEPLVLQRQVHALLDEALERTLRRSN
jgi:alpha/beta superfamily hydrolase